MTSEGCSLPFRKQELGCAPLGRHLHRHLLLQTHLRCPTHLNKKNKAGRRDEVSRNQYEILYCKLQEKSGCVVNIDCGISDVFISRFSETVYVCQKKQFEVSKQAEKICSYECAGQ